MDTGEIGNWDKAIKSFINDIGCTPTIMCADRDFKLIGGSVASYLETLTLHDNVIQTPHVSGAPDGHRNQNGLIEIQWKKSMTLARSWLASNLLLTKFWYFAVKQAVQVCNYTPIKKTQNGQRPLNKCTNKKQTTYGWHPSQKRCACRLQCPAASDRYFQKCIRQGHSTWKLTHIHILRGTSF